MHDPLPRMPGGAERTHLSRGQAGSPSPARWALPAPAALMSGRGEGRSGDGEGGDGDLGQGEASPGRPPRKVGQSRVPPQPVGGRAGAGRPGRTVRDPRTEGPPAGQSGAGPAGPRGRLRGGAAARGDRWPGAGEGVGTRAPPARAVPAQCAHKAAAAAAPATVT